MSDTNCLFCKIVEGEISTQFVYQDEQVIAFNDISPKAPLHILVVPRTHYDNVVELANVPHLLAHLVKIGQQVADGDHTLVFNTGKNAGQTVFHVHGHIMGGAGYVNPLA